MVTTVSDQAGGRDDAHEIAAVTAAYCETVDAGIADPDGTARQLGRFFTPDVAADYAGFTVEGRERLVAFVVDNIIGTSDGLFHAIHSPNIVVAGNTATGRWTCMARRKHKGEDDFRISWGRYVNDYVRTGDGWRISALRFVMA